MSRQRLVRLRLKNPTVEPAPRHRRHAAALTV